GEGVVVEAAGLLVHQQLHLHRLSPLGHVGGKAVDGVGGGGDGEGGVLVRRLRLPAAARQGGQQQGTQQDGQCFSHDKGTSKTGVFEGVSRHSRRGGRCASSRRWR